MIGVYYENYIGGVNNLCVAARSKTGLAATSAISKETASGSLSRKMRRYRRKREKCRKQSNTL